MNQYEVTLTFKVEAKSLDEAIDIAGGACRHLLDTFNNDGSMLTSRLPTT